MYTKAVIKGRDLVLQRMMDMEKNSGKYIVTVGIGATTPTHQPKHWTEKPRTAGQNKMILNAQAKKGRKIDFLAKEDIKQLSQAWKHAINKQIKNHQNQVSKQSKKIGQSMVDIFKGHISKGISKKGSMPPLTKLYSILKNTRYGGGKKTLIATGQLMNSFIFEVKKI